MGYHRSSARIPFPSPAYFAAALGLHHSMVSPFPSLCGEPMHDAGEKETPPSDRHVVVRKPLLPAPCVRSVSLCASENPLPPSAVLRSRSRLAIGSNNLIRVFPGSDRGCLGKFSFLISIANMCCRWRARDLEPTIRSLGVTAGDFRMRVDFAIGFAVNGLSVN